MRFMPEFILRAVNCESSSKGKWMGSPVEKIVVEVHQHVEREVHQEVEGEVHQEVEEELDQEVEEELHQEVEGEVHQEVEEELHQEEEFVTGDNQCAYASSRAGHLRKHLKTNSGEKSNKCNQCD